jgi:hypothetical protein
MCRVLILCLMHRVWLAYLLFVVFLLPVRYHVFLQFLLMSMPILYILQYMSLFSKNTL